MALWGWGEPPLEEAGQGFPSSEAESRFFPACHCCPVRGFEELGQRILPAPSAAAACLSSTVNVQSNVYHIVLLLLQYVVFS